MTEKPEEFKATIVKDENGNESISVQARTEIITHPNGSQDVIIHAPALSLIAKAKKDFLDK